MSFIRELGSDELIDLGLKSDEQFLKPLLEDMPRHLRQATEHTDSFWHRQRATIHVRIVKSERFLTRPTPLLAWACIGLLMAVAAMAVMSVSRYAGPASTARNAVYPALVQPGSVSSPGLSQDPDHEFLLEVEESLQSGGPSALAPASVLAQETSLYSTSLSTRKKEPVHEN